MLSKTKIETLIQARTKRQTSWLRRWGTHLAHALRTGDFRPTPGGIIVFDDKRLHGEYFFTDRPGSTELRFCPNLVVDQGLMKALGLLFYSDAKVPDWYVTMFSGSTAPTSTLTAANVAATLGEITSTTEGFSNATRPKFVASAPVANTVSNDAAMATFNIVATTSIPATGGIIVSSDVRGGTSGTLYSAALWDAPRELFNGESFKLGYQTSLTD